MSADCTVQCTSGFGEKRTRSWVYKRNAEREDKEGGNDSQTSDLDTLLRLAAAKSRAVAALVVAKSG